MKQPLSAYEVYKSMQQQQKVSKKSGGIKKKKALNGATNSSKISSVLQEGSGKKKVSSKTLKKNIQQMIKTSNGVEHSKAGKDSMSTQSGLTTNIKKDKNKEPLNKLPKVNAKTNSDKSFIQLLSSSEEQQDSRDAGKNVLSHILHPYSVDDFFAKFWEEKHLLIKGHSKNHFNGLFSTKIFDDILRNQTVEFTKNLDITSYSEGQRLTHNPLGKAYPSVVWDYFKNGCSVRFLNPQTFCEPVWQMLSALQDYFGSFCGANIYLTPSDSQGFAPHWDDIEAFVIQLEGRKRWRVYKPRSENETLPRYSSHNLSQSEIGEPLIDEIIEPGDVLYFPRGFIHQAEAVAGSHSLHITVSTYQKNTWTDLIEKMLSPSCLSLAAAKSKPMRRGLPLELMNSMGKLMNKGKNADSRDNIKQQLKTLLIDHLVTDEVLDGAVDEMARSFIRVSLPPHISSAEKQCCVLGAGERWTAQGVKGSANLEPNTKIKLIRANSCRVVKDSSDVASEYRLYHNLFNSREYEGRDEQYLLLDKKHLPAMKLLVSKYPHYISVNDLPIKKLDDKMSFVTSLWEFNLLRQPKSFTEKQETN